MGDEFKGKRRKKSVKITHEPTLNRFHHTPKDSSVLTDDLFNSRAGQLRT